jgi:hypothetical protein
MVWQKLGSPELIPSAITLRAYDGQPSSLEGLFQNVPVELGGKTILIDIEVIDAPLDYNILFGRSYMYAMKVVAYSIFQTMMFPHDANMHHPRGHICSHKIFFFSAQRTLRFFYFPIGKSSPTVLSCDPPLP